MFYEQLRGLPCVGAIVLPEASHSNWTVKWMSKPLWFRLHILSTHPCMHSYASHFHMHNKSRRTHRHPLQPLSKKHTPRGSMCCHSFEPQCGSCWSLCPPPSSLPLPTGVAVWVLSSLKGTFNRFIGTCWWCEPVVVPSARRDRLAHRSWRGHAGEDVRLSQVLLSFCLFSAHDFSLFSLPSPETQAPLGWWTAQLNSRYSCWL